MDKRESSDKPFKVSAEPATVLLVDDEPLSRSAARRVLMSLGYHVLEAEGADRARDLVASSQPIDLLISDVNMPDMNGFDLCDQLRQLRPGLRALFMSGYPAETIENVPEGAQIVDKPFTHDDLARRVSEMLRSAAPR